MRLGITHFQEDLGTYGESVYFYLGEVTYSLESVQELCFIFKYLMGMDESTIESYINCNASGNIFIDGTALEKAFASLGRSNDIFIDTNLSFVINLEGINVDLAVLKDLKVITAEFMINVKSSLSSNNASLLLVEEKSDEFFNAMFSIPENITKLKLLELMKIGTIISPEFESNLSLLVNNDSSVMIANLKGLHLRTTTTAVSFETIREKFPKVAALINEDFSNLTEYQENVFPCYG